MLLLPGRCSLTASLHRKRQLVRRIVPAWTGPRHLGICVHRSTSAVTSDSSCALCGGSILYPLDLETSRPHTTLRRHADATQGDRVHRVLQGAVPDVAYTNPGDGKEKIAELKLSTSARSAVRPSLSALLASIPSCASSIVTISGLKEAAKWSGVTPSRLGLLI